VEHIATRRRKAGGEIPKGQGSPLHASAGGGARSLPAAVVEQTTACILPHRGRAVQACSWSYKDAPGKAEAKEGSVILRAHRVRSAMPDAVSYDCLKRSARTGAGTAAGAAAAEVDALNVIFARTLAFCHAALPFSENRLCIAFNRGVGSLFVRDGGSVRSECSAHIR